MNAKLIIERLKKSNYKRIEAVNIKIELRKIPITERVIILNRLEDEKTRSDNSDVIDVINDVINEFKPKK